ncbi:hypothetical protein [Nocardioides stalactiti]|uniref:hypothetical protein n=1 Tax=Nocardioides stalactiti TaxID=2755356 RepID=UPI0015FF031F|nr:hypothetical protein [Nocardioides stalactiti]
MSDPIEKLTRLGDAMEGAPMPLAASEIRARGDRIRRRRHAVIAGVSAAVVTAVAVPVIALAVTGDDKADPDRFAPSPTVTDSVPVPGALELNENNLLSEADAIWYEPGQDWTAGRTLTDDGQAPPNPCMQTSFAGLGATTVLQRDFTFTAQTDPSDPWPYLTEIVGEFPSAAAAQSAYAEIQGWYDDCRPTGAEDFTSGPFLPVEIPVDGEGSHVNASYGPVDERLDPFGDQSWYLDTGLVVTGDRIALVTALSHGEDYNFEDTPAEQMVPVAAQRLAIGNDAPPTIEPTPGENGPTTIPADFPLASGWPEDDSAETSFDPPSADNQAMTAAGDLQACGTSAVDPGALDRLTTRWNDPTDFRIRELRLFTSDQEAAAYVADLRALYEACPTSGSAPTFTTTVSDGAIGDESVVVTSVGDEIYRTVINVVRIGNAVAVDLTSDEGLASDVDSLATETRENLADVVGAMYELQPAAPSDPGSDGPGSAGEPATSIPADFPLDLALGEPPVDNGETTVDGPSAEAQGARPQTMCGGVLAFPSFGSTDVDEPDLAYTVSAIEGYEGRTLRVYPSADAAVAQMELLRSQVQGCDRDRAEGGLSDRLWRMFNSDTGYDSVTFGYTYEVVDGVGAPAGQLYTVMRVGTAILALEYGGEYSAEFQAEAAPGQVDLAQLLSGEMCIFTEAGC